jgi:hypothetical protein
MVYKYKLYSWKWTKRPTFIEGKKGWEGVSRIKVRKVKIQWMVVCPFHCWCGLHLGHITLKGEGEDTRSVPSLIRMTKTPGRMFLEPWKCMNCEENENTCWKRDPALDSSTNPEPKYLSNPTPPPLLNPLYYPRPKSVLLCCLFQPL